MHFQRMKLPCRRPGCPNMTTRIMADPGHTLIVLCEFHLAQVMRYLKESEGEATSAVLHGRWDGLLE